MLNITFLIPGFGDGGAQKQCIKLLNELSSRRDLNISLIYFYDGVHFKDLKTENVHLVRLDARSNYDPRNIVKISKEIARFRSDILLTWLHSCDVYGFFLKRLAPRMKWIMTERDSHYPKEFRYQLRKWTARFADAIICNSTKGVAYWERSDTDAPLFYAPNIVTPSDQYVSMVSSSKQVIFVGRLERQKNVETVCRSFCILAHQRPDLSFTLVGQGSLEQSLSDIIASEGLKDRIRLTGFHIDAPSLIASARVLVTLSHHEGTPNVALEAVSSNTAVVASDISEHRALFGETYPFYVHDRTDPEECARVIAKLLSDNNTYGALEHARTKLNQMTASKVGSIYTEVFQILTRH